MSHHWKLRALLVVAVCSVAGGVLVVTSVEGSDEQRAARQLTDGQRMLSALVHSHSAVVAFADDRDPADLAELAAQRNAYQEAQRDARAAGGDNARRTVIDRQNTLASAFFDRTREGIVQARRGQLTTRLIDGMSELLHNFERENAAYSALIQRQQSAAVGRARWRSAGLVVVLSVAFAAIGQALVTRSHRQERGRQEREQTHRDDQREFSEVLQVTESEPEAYDLIKRHLERSVPASVVTVMSRNNSRDRLEARTELPAGSELGERLLDAQPRSCLAIRLAREHSTRAHGRGLLTCGVCVGSGNTTCVPSLVGGEVMGSVLVQHAQPLSERDRNQVVAAVGQAAPTLANLRNLALAEARALTDALTGLPNTRAVYDTLKRMVAQAGRTLTPLSAVMLDLDHFKQVNDSLGHEKGDEALAAVGDALGNCARASDFVGRYGGEEFLVLLPDTGKAGALELAEKLRDAVSLLRVPGTDRGLTTSCGVATYPDDAKNPENLLRLADRALYAAKSSGRNRVAEAVLDDDDREAANVEATTTG